MATVPGSPDVKPRLTAADARELPETDRSSMPADAEWWTTVADGKPNKAGCAQHRTIYWSPQYGWRGGPWQRRRPNASRVTVDGVVYEGRNGSRADAVYSALLQEDNRGRRGDGEPVLVSWEPICGARHAKMKRVSE